MSAIFLIYKKNDISSKLKNVADIISKYLRQKMI